MELFTSPAAIIISILVICLGATYLFIAWQSERARQVLEKEKLPVAVQCPKCERWKEMHPIKTKSSQEKRLNLTSAEPKPQIWHIKTHFHKCPFCGHQWEEHYESVVGY